MEKAIKTERHQFLCKVCKVKFNSKRSRAQHMRVHKGGNGIHPEEQKPEDGLERAANTLKLWKAGKLSEADTKLLLKSYLK